MSAAILRPVSHANADSVLADARTQRLRAGRLALAVGVLVFGGKLLGYALTGSTAVFSDAMESVVNVAAGGVLLLSLIVAARPADRDHPYGHGKVEYFSAGLEGAFLLVAAGWVVFEAAHALAVGHVVHSLDVGLACVVAASAANAALGSYLVRVGERTRSAALVADGRHVLTDVWTTAGVVVGLGAVALTDLHVLDPLVAIAVGLHILRQAVALMRESVRGLMDEADETLLAAVAAAMEAQREDSWIDVHGLRCRRVGAAVHTDLHLVVPRYFEVERLHRVHDAVAGAIGAAVGHDSETVVHYDPCRPHDCPHCAMAECPVRESPLTLRYRLTLQRATRSDQVAEAASPQPRPAAGGG